MPATRAFCFDSSASKDYCVLVSHAYVDRVQQALGGSVAGDLEQKQQRHSSLYLATIGSSSPASLMAMGRKEVSRALCVPHAATTFDEAIAAICAAICVAADPAVTLGPLPLLRIDTVPKAGFGDATSAALLAAAAAGGLGPGGDALELTRSASKAVLVLPLPLTLTLTTDLKPKPKPKPNPDQALENFKRACDCGRGAIFLSVARGKVAGGVDQPQPQPQPQPHPQSRPLPSPEP